MSQQEVAAFLKKRASMEEDYGRTLQKLARNTAEAYGAHDAKAGYVGMSPILYTFF